MTTKIIQFPKTICLGDLYVHDGTSNPPQLIPAKGPVTVPSGSIVTLNVRLNDKLKFRNLQWLQPDDIDILVIDSIELNDKSLSVLKHLSGLKSLIIRNDPVCYGSFLKEFVRDVRLSKLCLDNTMVNDRQTAYLSTLQTQLKALAITRSIYVKDQILETLAFYRGGILDLSDTGLTGLAVFGEQFGTGLRALSMARTRISDGTLRSLHADQKSHLEYLDISYTPITGEGIQHLGTIPTLKYLNVAGTRLDSQALARVSSQFPQLETLHTTDMATQSPNGCK